MHCGAPDLQTDLLCLALCTHSLKLYTCRGKKQTNKQKTRLQTAEIELAESSFSLPHQSSFSSSLSVFFSSCEIHKNYKNNLKSGWCPSMLLETGTCKRPILPSKHLSEKLSRMEGWREGSGTERKKLQWVWSWGWKTISCKNRKRQEEATSGDGMIVFLLKLFCMCVFDFNLAGELLVGQRGKVKE